MSSTDPQRAAVRLATAVGALGLVVGGARCIAPSLRTPSAIATFALSAALLTARWLAPGALGRALAPVSRALLRAGDVVGAATLSVAFVLVVWPYASLHRALRRLPDAHEPWPPGDESGWVSVESGARARTARPGSWLAQLAVRAGSARAVLGYLADRPSAYLVPLLVLLFALGVLALLGDATGLGPLIYTLF